MLIRAKKEMPGEKPRQARSGYDQSGVASHTRFTSLCPQNAETVSQALRSSNLARRPKESSLLCCKTEGRTTDPDLYTLSVEQQLSRPIDLSTIGRGWVLGF